jgi:hypothetical protein
MPFEIFSNELQLLPFYYLKGEVEKPQTLLKRLDKCAD